MGVKLTLQVCLRASVSGNCCVCCSDYKDYCTDSTVRFVVKMSADNMSKAEQAGLHRTFKLQTTLSISSMVWHCVHFSVSELRGFSCTINYININKQ